MTKYRLVGLISLLFVLVVGGGICAYKYFLGDSVNSSLDMSEGFLQRHGERNQAKMNPDSIVFDILANNSFRTISVADGLPSQDVSALMKDKQGYLWIGTSRGLARFDGVHVYPCQETLNEDVWSLAEVGEDTLLVGTASGLKLYSRYRAEISNVDMPATIVKTICLLSADKVVLGTEDGLFSWNPQGGSQENGKVRKIRIETGMGNSNHITGILRDGKGGCWFSTADGLGHLEEPTGHIQIYRMPPMMENSNFFNCLSMAGSTIYLGSFNKGVFAFDVKDKAFRKVAGFEHNLILSTSIVGHSLLVGTNGLGLKAMDLCTGVVSSVRHDGKQVNSLASNTVTNILYADGIPWIATQFGGLCYLPRSDKQYKLYSYGSFYSSDYHVRSFYEFSDGAKLIGTRTGLFYIDEKKHIIKTYRLEDGVSGLRSDIITYLNKIGTQVLVGTFGGGIHVFDEQTLSLRDLSQEELTIYGCVFDIYLSRTGSMWVATQDGLYQMTAEGHVVKHFMAENSPLATSAIYKVCEDAVGRLLIGTRFGLYLMDLKNDKIVQSEAVPSRAQVSYILLDSEKTMWVACDQGLYRFDEDLKLMAKYDGVHKLPENKVVSIYEEKKGVYWVATRKAITCMDLIGQHDVSHSYMGEINDCSFNNSLVCRDDSTIWWPNEGGLVSANLHLRTSSRIDRGCPRVTAILSDGNMSPIYNKVSSGDQEMTVDISSSVSRVELLLSNLQYLQPYANAYEYTLEGYDQEWRELDGGNSVVYDKLPAGNYVFKVRNPNTRQGSLMVLHVQRSYKVMAAFVCFLLALLVVVIYSYRRMSYLRRRLKRERNVLSTAIQTRKQTLQSRKVNGEEAGELEDRLMEYMQEKKPYLNPKLTIREVASELASTETEISLLLNNKMKVNWSNFVNAYRVDEMKRRLLKEGLGKLTLVAMAEQCGFLSKTTFYRVFKQATGMTPLEYCKQNKIAVPNA